MRRLSSLTWVNGFEAGWHSLEIYPAGTALNYRAGAGGEWVAISVEKEVLQSTAIRQLGHELDLPQTSAVSLRVPVSERRELDHQVRRIMARTQATEVTIEGFVGFLTELMDGLCNGNIATLIRRSQKRRELIERAERYLRGHLHEPFDARRLATAVGSTERSLQRHFAGAYGTTPHQWARFLALHGVRDRLRKMNSRLLTIEGVARDFGFLHMGRFAEYYHSLFGELPSETMVARR